MAALSENLLPLLTETRDTVSGFRRRGEQSLKTSENRRMELQRDLSTFQKDKHLSRAVRLQWRWQELRERERQAQQHNRQLLQEFERAQDTLRDMVARTAAMNTIRMEYERYLEESSPRWQQQLKEKTLSAQRKRMEEYLKESLNRMEEGQETRPFTEAHPSPWQGHTKPQKAAVPVEYHTQTPAPKTCHPDYNQDRSSPPRISSIQSSWLTQTPSYLARFPNVMPCDPQGSSLIPPSFHPPPILPQPHPSQSYHFSSTPSHRHITPQQGLPLRPVPQTNYPLSWGAGVAGFPSGPQVPWTQPPEPPGWGLMQGVEGEAERSTVPSPQGKSDGGDAHSGGGSRQLSQELDIKPVRLSSGHGETSDSSKDSSQANAKIKSRDRRKRREEKRRRTERSSSDREGSSSQESSRTSSAVVVASAAHGSGSDTPSEIGSSSTRRSGVLTVKPPRTAKKPRERTRSKGEDSGSRREESPTVEVDAEQDRAEGEDEGEEQGEEDGPGEMDRDAEEPVDEDDDDDDDVMEDKESGQRDGGEGCVRENEGENGDENEEDEVDGQEPEDPGEDEEQSDGEVDEESNGDEGSDTSQDREVEEHVGEGDEEKAEEEEEEQMSGEAGEDSQAGEPEETDSDDSIISPQEHRSKKTHCAPEEEEEEEAIDDEDDGKESKTEDKDDEDDIEYLLAPQAETQKKEEKDTKACDSPKALSEDLETFSEELDIETKAVQDPESDEFDHFYD